MYLNGRVLEDDHVNKGQVKVDIPAMPMYLKMIMLRRVPSQL